jgi:hypothetical protein
MPSGRRGRAPASRSIRPLLPWTGTFAAGIVRATTRRSASAVRAPAPSPGCPRRSRTRLRANSSAGFRSRHVGSGGGPVRSPVDPSAPEPDSSSRKPGRRVRIRSVVSGVGFVGFDARCATAGSKTGAWVLKLPARPRRNRSYHRSAAVPRLRHWRRLSSLASLGMTDATSFRRFPMSPPCSLRDSETLGVRSR